MSLNIDSLAESYYASDDPTFRNDEEMTEAEVMTTAVHYIEALADELNENEKRIALDHIDDLYDCLAEALGR